MKVKLIISPLDLNFISYSHSPCLAMNSFEVGEGTVSKMGISSQYKIMHYEGEAGYMILGMTCSNSLVFSGPCSCNIKRHNPENVMQEAVAHCS